MSKIKLVDEARNAWKLFSVQIMGVLGILALVQTQWDYLSVLVPQQYRPYVVALFSIAAIAGRLLAQPETVIEGKEKKIEALATKSNELAVQANVAAATGQDEKAVALSDKAVVLETEAARIAAEIQVVKS